ncbi:hypothetical protein LPJ60_003008, partial [Coemansia sp. RSA 2675]
MNHFFYDFTKTGSVDITDNNATVTVSTVAHNADVCICDNCKKLRLAKQEAMMKHWNFH